MHTKNSRTSDSEVRSFSLEVHTEGVLEEISDAKQNALRGTTPTRKQHNPQELVCSSIRTPINPPITLVQLSLRHEDTLASI